MRREVDAAGRAASAGYKSRVIAVRIARRASWVALSSCWLCCCVAPPSANAPEGGPKAPLDFGAPNGPASVTALVPLPKLLHEDAGQLQLEAGARVVADAAAAPVAQQLAEILRRSTGFALPVVAPPAKPGDIELVLRAGDAALGDEGYQLDVTDRVTLRAAKPAGLSYAATTLRQMLPPEVEANA